MKKYLIYDDGRDGHRGRKAEILSEWKEGMIVQFEDRADTTTIMFHDKAWMDKIEITQCVASKNH